MASRIGAEIAIPDDSVPLHAWLFGEDQARYVVTTDAPEEMLRAAADAGVPAAVIGRTGGASLTVQNAYTISIDELRAGHETWLPDYMAGE